MYSNGIIPSQPELNRIASGISEGYLKMFCSYSGLGVEFSSRDIDNLGIDGSLVRSQRLPKLNGDGFTNKKIGNRVEFQLKSCYSENNFKELNNSIKYNIGTDFFDKLELNEDKFILIILQLPPAQEFEKWLEIQEDYTKIQKCAYFTEVKYQDKNNWIEISNQNLLTPENLQKLFIKPEYKPE